MTCSVQTYLVQNLWDDDVGTFADGTDDGAYTITPRDTGDITGGVNAVDAVLGLDGVKQTFATHFNDTFNRGRLQRATRWQASRPRCSGTDGPTRTVATDSRGGVHSSFRGVMHSECETARPNSVSPSPDE